MGDRVIAWGEELDQVWRSQPEPIKIQVTGKKRSGGPAPADVTSETTSKKIKKEDVADGTSDKDMKHHWEKNTLQRVKLHIPLIMKE